MTTAYVGRFAPSPTGPLHFGSLVAAAASYLDARAHQGEWRVRMEDVDETRSQPGAADDILRTLDAFGFEWDGEVLVQSRRKPLYADALQTLHNRHLTYRCTCTRSELQALGNQGIYPGLCADKHHPEHVEHAVRLRMPDEVFGFHDAIQGDYRQNLKQDVGDFVIRRRDGLFAYQLAVVVDDAEQGISHVVRGADLLDNTPRQIYVQQCLRVPTPAYAHVPVAVNATGEKLSKQTYAPAVRPGSTALFDTLGFLGQTPPAELQFIPEKELWPWALANWDLARVPTQFKSVLLHA